MRGAKQNRMPWLYLNIRKGKKWLSTLRVSGAVMASNCNIGIYVLALVYHVQIGVIIWASTVINSIKSTPAFQLAHGKFRDGCWLHRLTLPLVIHWVKMHCTFSENSEDPTLTRMIFTRRLPSISDFQPTSLYVHIWVQPQYHMINWWRDRTTEVSKGLQ